MVTAAHIQRVQLMKYTVSKKLHPFVCKIPQITYFTISITNIIVTHRNAR